MKKMNLRVVILSAILLFFMACEKEDNAQLNKLVNGVWVLESRQSNSEKLDFKTDMTYEIETYLESSIVYPNLPNEAFLTTGEWSLNNSAITFETANIELPESVGVSTNNNVDIIEGGSIISFWGVEVGSANNRPDSLPVCTEFIPVVWNIVELTNELLIVNNGTETISYTKL